MEGVSMEDGDNGIGMEVDTVDFNDFNDITHMLDDIAALEC